MNQELMILAHLSGIFLKTYREEYLPYFGLLADNDTKLVLHTQTDGRSSKVPTGQKKKETGSKLAKPFAPGQQKKILTFFV